MKKLSIATIASGLMSLGVLAAAPAQASTFSVNFDEGFVGTPGDGTRITDQYYNDLGITFSTDRSNGLVLYDSECVGKGGNKGVSTNGFTNVCTGGDRDLATGKGGYKQGGEWYYYDTEAQGNVLIIQENSSDTPDDQWDGGEININFATSDTSGNQFYENGITLENLLFVDLDEAILGGKQNGQKALEFSFEYVDSSRNPFEINSSNYSNYITEQWLSKDWDGNELRGDNSLAQHFFNNEGGEFDGIKEVTVRYKGISGAIGGFNYSATPGNDPAEVPEPSSTIALLGLIGLGMSGLKKKGNVK